MKPLGDVEKISGIAFGFMASKALFSALHLGVFDRLAEQPRSLKELADLTEADAPQLETLLTGLVAIDLLEKDDDTYRNASESETYLVRGKPNYYGDYLCYQIDRQMYPFMEHLVDALKGQTERIKYEDYETWMADPEQARLFSESQHHGSLGPGAVVAKRIDLSGARTLLDVGGGTGAFSIMMAKRYPELTCTVLDFPNVVKLGEKLVAEADLQKRISFLGGNALKTEWPGQQDAILMSYLMSGVPGDSIPGLLDTAFDSMAPGGTIILHDFMVEDDRAGPPLAAMWALQHMVFTPRAASLTPGYLADLLEKSGFASIRTMSLIPGMTKVVYARKPRTQ